MTICFYNGEFLPEEDVKFHLSDRGLTLGDGVFDTQKMMDGVLTDSPAHFERLIRHAAAIHISCPYTAAEINEFAQKLTLGPAIIRTVLTRGPAARGLVMPERATPTLLMRAMPLPDLRLDPVVMISSIRRNETSPLSYIKATNYLDAIMALQTARSHGFDDAIFLNTQGFVTCATTSNIFIVEGKNWITPPLSDGIVDGITRAGVIREKNAHESQIDLPRLYKADEIWLTNSVMGLRKVKELSQKFSPEMKNIFPPQEGI
jgi:branched-chain amino acid aminotransferase